MVLFFKDKSAVAVFWLIVVCLGLHAYSLAVPPKIMATGNDGFFYYLFNPFKNAGDYLVSLFYVFLVFLTALQLNFVVHALNMFPKPSYTPALAFILFSALLPSFNVITVALFASNFFIWILYQACKIYAAPNSKTAIYNLGLMAGLCIVFYYASAPLVLIVMLALAIMRPFRLNEWFVLFFGLITPAYFLAAYLFLTNQFNLLPPPTVLFDVIRLPVQPAFIIASLAVAAVTVLWGMYSVQHAGSNVLIQVRKSWSVFLISIIFLTPVMFFITGAFPQVLLLVAVPAACYTGFAFASSRTIFPALFFWALLILAIYNNWFAKY